ncbi:MAG: right-handed parallel beta-helix repeat-containing protein, partial [Bacteroidetes bacterium]|nr:right-handed parallel beta-helix repeat-containing protein [Bacteroidota bacterium]
AFKENAGEGMMWLYGYQLDHFRISGGGTIDGNGIAFMGAELEDSYVLKPFQGADPRPHVLTIIGGRDIRIRDLTIRNSAYWTVHLVGCDDVVVSGITLLNSLKVRNSDGIDVDHSRNVRISDCYIESGDDCICLKNRREYAEFGSCEDITVSNCVMTSRSCAVKIGSENMDTIRRVVFNNCIIRRSNRGIGIQHRDEGMVSDVLFSNMVVDSHLFSDVWWGKAEPIYVTAFRRARGNNKDAGWRFPKGATEGRVGMIKNIRFSNIRCSSENGIFVSGESADKIEGVSFDQVSVFIEKTTMVPGGMFDRRPAQGVGMVQGHAAAFFFDTATDVRVSNCVVRWGKSLQGYYTYALESRAVVRLELNGLSGKSAFPGKLPVTRITK